MNEIRDLMVGIDFGAKSTQVCYFDRKADEPLSLSMRTGSEVYESPTLLTRRVQGDYVVGLEAEYFAAEKGGQRIAGVYELARMPEDSVVPDAEGEKTPAELLSYYLKGVLRYLGVADLPRNARCISITTRRLTSDMVRNLTEAMGLLGFSRDQFLLLDYEESFYYYVMSQKKELLNRNVGWYIFDGNEVSFRKLDVNLSSRPIQVSLQKQGKTTTLPEEPEARDVAFCQFIDHTLEKELYASIQISGSGFDPEWAIRSVKMLCYQKRKVYYGNNLFARGACAAGKERKEDRRMKGYLFLSDALVRQSLGMEMRVMGSPTYHPLVEGGRNWYECTGECELILDDTDQLVFLVSKEGGEKKRVAMALPGLPARPNRTTRLHLSLAYQSATDCLVTVQDLGFGDMYPASGKVWKDHIREEQ